MSASGAESLVQNSNDLPLGPIDQATKHCSGPLRPLPTLASDSAEPHSSDVLDARPTVFLGHICMPNKEKQLMGEQSGKVICSQRSAGSWLTRENPLGTRAFLAECPSNANLRYCAPGWTLFPPGNQVPISNVSLYHQSVA